MKKTEIYTIIQDDNFLCEKIKLKNIKLLRVIAKRNLPTYLEVILTGYKKAVFKFNTFEKARDEEYRITREMRNMYSKEEESTTIEPKFSPAWSPSLRI